MGILEAYDKDGTPVITPDKVYDTKIRHADTCIVTFSHTVLEKVLEEFRYEVAGQFGSANGMSNVYYLPEQDVLFFMSAVGAPAAACTLQEVQYLGDVKNFIYFGSCGLIGDIAGDKVIVPTEAYREEGFSYHYLPPSDYVTIENHEMVKKVLTRHRIPCVSGRTWTTDATAGPGRRTPSIWRRTTKSGSAKKTAASAWRWSRRRCRRSVRIWASISILSSLPAISSGKSGTAPTWAGTESGTSSCSRSRRRC